MKALILGGGFAGTTTAFLLKRKGWDVTLIEKEPHLGGGCRTFFHCGHPFTYGPRVYYGYSQKVWDWVNRFVPMRRFPFELRTLAHEPEDEARRFWHYPPHEDDVALYPRAEQIKAELATRDNSAEPRDFDEYYRQKIGPTLYDMFVDRYSKKMWMIDDNRVFDIFKWSAKDRPLESGARGTYKDSLLGYPIATDGYNRYFDAMVEGIDVKFDRALKRPRTLVDGFSWSLDGVFRPDVIISTIPIDELCGYAFGELQYVGREFHLLVLPCAEVFPGDVRFCHYASDRDEWTRVTEFRKITGHGPKDSTLLVLEKPSKANKLYPYLTKANQAKVTEYQKMLPPNVYSIGRLGTYKYSTIENTISQAAACVAKITGKPNELADQFFAIGDKSMLPKDRKESAL